jgi:hypothetical protein
MGPTECCEFRDGNNGDLGATNSFVIPTLPNVQAPVFARVREDNSYWPRTPRLNLPVLPETLQMFGTKNV